MTSALIRIARRIARVMRDTCNITAIVPQATNSSCSAEDTHRALSGTTRVTWMLLRTRRNVDANALLHRGRLQPRDQHPEEEAQQQENGDEQRRHAEDGPFATGVHGVERVPQCGFVVVRHVNSSSHSDISVTI
jgi:hypothetical protein